MGIITITNIDSIFVFLYFNLWKYKKLEFGGFLGIGCIVLLRNGRFFPDLHDRKSLELSLSLLVGLLLGLLIVFTPSLPLSPDYQKLVYVIPFALTIVILFNNPEKLILAAIAIGVPLNLDVSLIISPYARNFENLSRGYRTLIATTELRVSFVTIAIVIGYILWLVRPVSTERRSAQFFSATTIPALGLIFISILSVVQAPDKQLWFFRVEQLVEMFLIYFYLVNHIQTSQDMQFFLIVLLGGLLAESVLMILQWITGLTFSIAGLQAMMLGPGRVGGTLGHTGPAAGYLSAMALIAMAMVWGFQQKSQKRLAVISMGLSMIALVSTGSRIGLGGFAVTLLAFLLTCLRHGWIKRETLILLVIAVLIIGIGSYGAISTRFSTLNNSSAQSRPMMWKLAWKAIQAHPWLGVGAGNYALVTRDYYSADVGLAQEVLDIQVHNAYLDIWAESGIFALLCYLGLFGGAIMKAWSCITSRSRFRSMLGKGLSLAIVSLCIQMNTGTFHLRSITLFVWLLVALAASLPHLEQSNDVCTKGLLIRND